MAVKLVNQPLELETLKAICSGDKAIASGLLGSLDESWFYTECAVKAFQRIKFIARERTEIISWLELITDPTLSEEHREILSSYKKQPSESLNIKGLLKNLGDFRKARKLQGIAEKIQQQMLGDSINVDEVLVDVNQQLLSARTGKDISQCFTRIGANSNTSDKLKKMLRGELQRYYPTGFKGWDNKNEGVAKGKIGILAATSGGGKSLCANQLALNFATNNIRTCIVPLEMSADDMLHRFLANKTDLNMTDITKAKDLTEQARKKAYQTFKAFERKLDETGTSIELYNPDTDITMEDCLMTLQPFEFNVIIIDYIGLLKGVDGEAQWQKLMDAVRFAKRWAETNQVSVIILAQLSDDMIIRYSKGMKEHADFMWSWNAGKMNEAEDGTKILKIEPQKGRNQAQDTFYLKVDYKKMSMVDATEQEIQAYELKKNKNHKNGSVPKLSQDNSLNVQSGELDPAL